MANEHIQMERVLTIDRLPVSSRSIPKQSELQPWNHLCDIQLPEAEEDEVMLLIGSDVPEAFWSYDERRGHRKEPYALKLLLGWTLIGPANQPGNDFHVNFIRHEDELLHKQVEKFWKTDFNDAPSLMSGPSLEDKKALTKMEETVTMEDEHYMIGLPWRTPKPDLPNNRTMAEGRMRLPRKRLMKDEAMREKYANVVNSYIERDTLRRYFTRVPWMCQNGTYHIMEL